MSISKLIEKHYKSSRFMFRFGNLVIRTTHLVIDITNKVFKIILRLSDNKFLHVNRNIYYVQVKLF